MFMNLFSLGHWRVGETFLFRSRARCPGIGIKFQMGAYVQNGARARGMGTKFQKGAYVQNGARARGMGTKFQKGAYVQNGARARGMGTKFQKGAYVQNGARARGMGTKFQKGACVQNGARARAGTKSDTGPKTMFLWEINCIFMQTLLINFYSSPMAAANTLHGRSIALLKFWSRQNIFQGSIFQEAENA